MRYVRLPGGVTGSGPQLTITIGAGYSGIWLPVPDGVTAAPNFSGSRAVALADAFYQDAASGSAIDVAAAAPSEAGVGSGYGLVDGDSYTVVAGTLETPQDFAIEQGTEARISADDYPQLAEWVERQAVPRTGAGLAELVDRLRDRGYLSHSLTDADGATGWIAELEARAPYEFLSSRAGHSTARLEAIFADLNDQEQRAGEDADPDALVAAVGDDEQFAAAAALLARYLGFESRVVVGVRLASDSASSAGAAPGIPNCVEVCTGANLTAWVEVGSPTGGWTALDVTPQFGVSPISITDGEKLPENPTTPDQPDVAPLDPPQAQRDDSEASRRRAARSPRLVRGVAARAAGRRHRSRSLGCSWCCRCSCWRSRRWLRRRSRRDDSCPEVSLVGAGPNWSRATSTSVTTCLSVSVAPRSPTRSLVRARSHWRPLSTAPCSRSIRRHPRRVTPGGGCVDDERRDLKSETPPASAAACGGRTGLLAP